jgi:hypothetical protein
MKNKKLTVLAQITISIVALAAMILSIKIPHSNMGEKHVRVQSEISHEQIQSSINNSIDNVSFALDFAQCNTSLLENQIESRFDDILNQNAFEAKFYRDIVFHFVEDWDNSVEGYFHPMDLPDYAFSAYYLREVADEELFNSLR